MSNQVPKHDHYLPRFILRGFGKGSKRQRKAWCFTKRTDVIEEKFVDDVGAQEGYYDSPIYGIGDDGADSVLKPIENDAAVIFNRIREEESLEPLSDNDRALLLKYVAVHATRNPASKSNVEELLNLFSASGMNIPPKATAHDFFAGHVKSGPHASIEHLANKQMRLLRASNTTGFVVSDNWIAMAADPTRINPVTRVGRAGLAVPGTELRLPLSKNLCLLLICPESSLLRINAYGDLKLNAVDVDDEWVEAFNIAQLCSAHQHVFGASDSWIWATEFLSQDDQYRGPQKNSLFDMLRIQI